MRRLLGIIGWMALLVFLVVSLRFVAGDMSLDRVKRWFLLATIVWFATALGKEFFVTRVAGENGV